MASILPDRSLHKKLTPGKMVLRLLGRDPDPAKSREQVLLSVLAEQRLRRGEPAPLSALLEEVLAWVRSLPGSSKLRAMLVFDEVYGFLPPHPKNPPTQREWGICTMTDELVKMSRLVPSPPST